VIGPELLQPLLLIRAEQRVDVGLQPRLGNREIRLHVAQLLHGGADLRFVEGDCFNRRPARCLRGAHAIHQRTHLLTILLAQLTHLLLLRVGQIEGAQRQACLLATHAEAGSPTGLGARSLRVDEDPAAGQRGQERTHTKNTKMTNHIRTPSHPARTCTVHSYRLSYLTTATAVSL
jgi:hypothetical protein